MKVVFGDNNVKTNFTIVPTSDREIIDQFIDFETGYLIVMERNKVAPSDRSIYYTIIDPSNGKIIDLERRQRQLDREKKVTIEETAGFKIITQRTLDASTGGEIIHEKLIDVTMQQEIMSCEAIAFRRKKRETLLEAYYRHEEHRGEVERFWAEEYPKYSFEEKKGYWFNHIYRSMRWQGESGYDAYAIFNQESYKQWKAWEPEIDAILDDVMAMLLPALEDEEGIREKVWQLCGRSEKK